MFKISVCVISYNQEEYIRQCLDSIVNQKGGFLLEIVIRDDCSSDKTFKICEDYVNSFYSSHVEFKLLDAERNIGPNKNLLEVFSHCTGDFIAFCEGDDYWASSEKLQIQLESALQNPNIDLFVHPAFYLYPNDKLVKEEWPLQKKDKMEQADILSATWQFAPTSSYFIRSRAIARLPDWFGNATIGDIYIELYAAENGIVAINKYLSVYRYLSPTSWSSSLSKRTKDVYFKRINHYRNFLNCLELLAVDYPGLTKPLQGKKNGIKFQLVKLFMLTKQYDLAKQFANEILTSKNDFKNKKIIFLKLTNFPLLLIFISKIISFLR